MTSPNIIYSKPEEKDTIITGPWVWPFLGVWLVTKSISPSGDLLLECPYVMLKRSYDISINRRTAERHVKGQYG